MRKLIDAYRDNPTDANRDKLVAYLDKHPMAACLLTTEEVMFLTLRGML